MSAPVYTTSTTHVQTGAPIVQATNAAGTTTYVDGSVAQPSSIGGNIEALVGKMTHNPEKQMHGNTRVAGSAEAKATRFEQKALEWDRKGNPTKANKNREKAGRYRQKAVTKLTAIPVAPKNRTPGVLTQRQADKITRFETRAIEAERSGNLSKAQKNRDKANRIRQKAGISNIIYASTATGPVPVGTTAATYGSVPVTTGYSTAAGYSAMPGATTTTHVHSNTTL
eukprot:TRINITY_DN251_c0_g1_i1.p1 TRINITY_DN251_c0_g1~~TRINITY_DN251_c0_g1_i1.p1  ORF type:complete len:226 (-),score=75.12 TRINITY_DN251_c0_g1_i1:101-778(-)